MIVVDPGIIGINGNYSAGQCPKCQPPVRGDASDEQAKIIADLFELRPEAEMWLKRVPYEELLPTAVPINPLIYRFYEMISVYGNTFKELIHEEFGDGVMSAIDFNMNIKRENDPKGDRVRFVMSGRFPPYKTY